MQKSSLALLVTLILANASAAVAQEAESLASLKQVVDKVSEEIGNEEAIALLPKLELALSFFEENREKDRENEFCAESQAEALYYVKNPSAVELPEAYCSGLYQSAYLYADMGKLDQARPILYRLRELSPLNSKYALELAYVLGPTGRYDEMLQLYQAAYDNAHLSGTGETKTLWRARALRGIGWVYADQRRWDEAEAALRKSLNFDPDSPMALGELEYVAKERLKDKN